MVVWLRLAGGGGGRGGRGWDWRVTGARRGAGAVAGRAVAVRAHAEQRAPSAPRGAPVGHGPSAPRPALPRCGRALLPELYPVPPRRDTNGDTERILGRWMAARGNREQVLITTKAGRAIRAPCAHAMHAGAGGSLRLVRRRHAGGGPGGASVGCKPCCGVPPSAQPNRSPRAGGGRHAGAGPQLHYRQQVRHHAPGMTAGSRQPRRHVPPARCACASPSAPARRAPIPARAPAPNCALPRQARPAAQGGAAAAAVRGPDPRGVRGEPAQAADHLH